MSLMTSTPCHTTSTTHLYMHGNRRSYAKGGNHATDKMSIMPAVHSTVCTQRLAEMVQACRLCFAHLPCMLCISIQMYLHNRGKIVYLLHCRSVSSFKQYFSPPISAFDKLCICHAAKCKTSSNQNNHSVLLPQYIQLGIQVIFLQGVTRYVQHGQGLQARLLARLACMQAAVKTGQASYTALDTGPFTVAGTVMALCQNYCA